MWVAAVCIETVRATARLQGVGKIVDFIHEGYVAFKSMDDVDFFF